MAGNRGRTVLMFAVTGLSTIIRSAMAHDVGSRLHRPETEPKDAGEQALMGWLPHDHGFVLGLPCARRRASVRRPAHNSSRGFPTVVLSTAVPSGILSSSIHFVPFVREIDQAANIGCTMRAMDEVKPTISRGIAVVTITFGFPAAASRR
jgi:hypothetical protein